MIIAIGALFALCSILLLHGVPEDDQDGEE